MPGTYTIDCFPESALRYRGSHAIVAVDVIRATTSIVTAAFTGRRSYPVASLDEALARAAALPEPLLVGELSGDVPPGFHMNNSPVELEQRADIERPAVFLSSSGTKLICFASGRGPVFLACFRNYAATARHLMAVHSRIALIGAGSRSEFREEDQMCCAWIANLLQDAGFSPANGFTADVAGRWRDAPASACIGGNSAAYLTRTGQGKDLDFIVNRVNDIDAVFAMHGDEVRMLPMAWRAAGSGEAGSAAA